MHVVATAGHVDHGKSTLVHALTGIDPDRFGEEKARGLTIDLGFAWATLPSGRGLAFVDVPGHIRFIKNMLAGVGAVDACLFVVAATEGWKPQSEEHLRILELLGVSHGLVALTKVAIVDDDHRELANMDVADHLAGTFLEGAEVVEVDAPTGGGLDELRAALDRLLATTPTAADDGKPRLWIDRSFAAKGSGTVVTGTLTGGRLAIDDEVVIVPDGQAVRVRALQSHQESLPAVGPGRRVAVNLVGVSHDDVERGDALVRPRQWHLTRRIDASLAVLATLDHEVSRRGAYVAYLGSGERPVRLRVLGGSALAPGDAGLVRLHLAEPLPLVPGDRYVLRETGRAETVGGGEVLDVDPLLPAARARPDRSVARVVAERGWVEAEVLERLVGVAQSPQLGPWVVDPSALARTRQAVEEAIDAAGPLGLDVAGLDPRERAVLATLEDVAIEAGRARRADAVDPLVGHPYLAVLDASLFTPPAPEGVDRGELRELVRRGLVLESDGTWFSPRSIQGAAAVLGPLLGEHPEGVTVAQIRDALGSSRKFLLPLLALLDGRGITRRRGDLRIAGPRLPLPLVDEDEEQQPEATPGSGAPLR